MEISSSKASLPINISLNGVDIDSMNNVIKNIHVLYNWLNERKVNLMIFDGTGVVIETRELGRAGDILNALLYHPKWLGE